MATAILEIRDDVAVGPLHQPTKTVLALDENELPLICNALCGARGYIYRRESLAALGHTTECQECVIAAKPKPKRRIYNPGPARYATDEERRAARLVSYNTYYQRKKQRKAAAAT